MHAALRPRQGALRILARRTEASRISCHRATRSDGPRSTTTRRPPLPGLIACPAYSRLNCWRRARRSGDRSGRASFYRRHAAVRHHARRADTGEPSLGIQRRGKGRAIRLSRAAKGGAAGSGSASGNPLLWTTPAETFRQMGADYVAALRPLAPSAARITDKMPINFVHVGLIHLILPRARIIHVVRDPVDTCPLHAFPSCLPAISHSPTILPELGRFCSSAYTRLMAHWRSLLPADVMLEVQYETLVQDFEPQARRTSRGALRHRMGSGQSRLPHRDAPRAVQTASMNRRCDGQSSKARLGAGGPTPGRCSGRCWTPWGTEGA